MRRVHLLILGLITLLALGLRTYRVESIPPSLSWDEVSIGYNAYSILKTGRDEHGKFLPLSSFVAYGDYKPPLSIYITVPFVAIFGLNELAVRLPSAVFGTATVVILYFLVRELLAWAKSSQTVSVWAGLAAAFLLGLSPWHINISRAGFEANIALFFVTLGALFMFLAAWKPVIWIFSLLPFAASVYTFNSARYFVGFLVLLLCIYLRRFVIKQKKLAVLGLVIGMLFLLPILPHLFSKEAWLRFREVNIFSDAAIVTTSNERIEAAGNAWWAKIVFNRRVGYARSFLLHYFDHFEPWYLFVRGDGNPKFSIQDVGQLYMADIPILAVGLFALFRNVPSVAGLMIAWLALSIVPAATARETPHALRTLNSIPAWYAFLGFGFYRLAVFLWRKTNTYFFALRGLLVLFFIIYLGNVGYYLHNYYSHYPFEYAHEWQYGYKQAVAAAAGSSRDYKEIYITDRIGRPYMYTLFYTKYDPAKFQNEKKSYFDADGFYHVTAFGIYRFSPNDDVVYKQNSLYIMPEGQLPEGASVVSRINLPGGKPVLSLFTVK